MNNNITSPLIRICTDFLFTERHVVIQNYTSWRTKFVNKNYSDANNRITNKMEIIDTISKHVGRIYAQSQCNADDMSHFKLLNIETF